MNNYFVKVFITTMFYVIYSLEYFQVYIQKYATLHSLFISGILLYMFRVVPPSIIRSTYNCMYSIWYMSNRYCYLPLSWKIFPALSR
jgi:hypothetical protein